MRTKGSYEYKKEAESMVYLTVTDTPQTTRKIHLLVKEKYFSKIHHNTVERLLTELYRKKVIDCTKIGQIKLWKKQR